MKDDSLKKKLSYDEPNINSMSPMSKLQKSPMMKAAMVHYSKAQNEIQQNPKLRNDLRVGSIGLLIGIVLGGLMATLGGDSALMKTVASNVGSGGGGNLAMVANLKRKGWNPVHVFYGRLNHITKDIPEKWFLKDEKKNHKGMEWFGQHGQDVAVAKFFNFKKNGYFVDLASNDAVWASNTFALEQNLEWKGICIEANPVYWYRLSFRTNCHVVGTVVGGKDYEEIEVNLPEDPKVGGPFGGIVGKDFDNKPKKNAKKDASEKRYTASLMSILEKFNAPRVIDYLSLDVEGAEEFIMKDFPFNRPYTFKVISIERPKDQLKKKLNQAGYKQVLDFKRGDTLWAHKSVYDSGKKNIEDKPHEIEKHQLDSWPKHLGFDKLAKK